MDNIPLQLIVIALLIVLNGFFAGAEISIISIRKSRLRNLISQGSKTAKLVGEFLKKPESFLATIQVGVTLAGTTASVMAGSSIVPILTPYLVNLGLKPHTAENVSVTAVVIALSILIIILGELIPKYVAYSFPERLALWSAPPINWFAKIAYVPSKLLSQVARMILRPFGLVDRKVETVVSEEEINLILSEGHKHGHFEKTERDLIEGVFEFADTTIRQAMTPRTVIAGIDLSASNEQMMRMISEEGYSRYPVYEDSLDNIKGIIHTKDVINLLIHDNLFILHDLIRPISFVPDSKMISAQLHDFQKNHQHMAIVLDDFGGTAGLITLEDILEEIVGEIRDEHDTEIEPFVLVNKHLCQVQGQFPIENFNKLFEAEIDEEGPADTIGGYLLNHIGKFPRQGEKVVIDNLQFEVVSVDGPRIDRMRVRKLE